MRNVSLAVSLFLGFTLLLSMTTPADVLAQHTDERNPIYWDVHDEDRPQPPVVDPGPAADEPAPVPSDATVLFDGSSLDDWQAMNGEDNPWNLEDGLMVVDPGTGDIQTRAGFGDVQLHVEWRVPEDTEGEGQNRGNSGVFLMGQYEVQVLDSYENETYPDGQAASMYGQYPPLVNAMRPPGEWQIYDIYFTRPHFDANGKTVKPAEITVFHNGVLVQEGVTLTGPTGHYQRPQYDAHDDELPIRLQDHGDIVQFRNIWVRELE